MSSMKDAYLNTLRPMDGQQADPPEPKLETTPVVDKKPQARLSETSGDGPLRERTPNSTLTLRIDKDE